jgi:hypothetical protein
MSTSVDLPKTKVYVRQLRDDPPVSKLSGRFIFATESRSPALRAIVEAAGALANKSSLVSSRAKRKRQWLENAIDKALKCLLMGSIFSFYPNLCIQ